jgi:quinone-modifying oxidoreductase, subunit QmoC
MKKGWSMRGVAFGLLKAGRLNPFELFGGHRCRDRKGIAAMLAKAEEIERRKQRPTG